MPEQPKLKIGLITDGGVAANYVSDLGNWIATQPHLEFTAEIIQNSWLLSRGKVLKKLYFLVRHRGAVKTLRSFYFRLASLIDKFLTYAISKEAIKFLNRSSPLSAATRVDVYPQISRSGFVYAYSERDIEKIRSLNCDVLIRCGTGILSGAILNCTKFGVLSFHHGDNQKYRGGPPGFWEVYRKEDQTGFIIQQLTEVLDGGNVLFRGFVETKPLFTWNKSNVIRYSNIAMYKILSDLAKNNCLPKISPQETLGELFRVPKIRESAKYLFATFVLLLKKVTQRVFNSRPIWSVVVFRAKWNEIGNDLGVHIPNPSGCFIADPFVVNSEFGDFIFVEEFSFVEKKAHIAAYKVDLERIERVGVALEENFHLSFPFIFKCNDTYFMCPETIAKREVRLYRCTDFPLKWELATTLLRDTYAVDPMIFFRDEKWWLLVNEDPLGAGDTSSFLNVYYSDDLLKSNWSACESNPVIFDASRARNGGLYEFENRLVRFGQVQGFDLYGKALRAFEITDISTVGYEEREIAMPNVNVGVDFYGTHHLSTSGAITAVDIFS